jgi:flagellar biosynthetic protein FliR
VTVDLPSIAGVKVVAFILVLSRVGPLFAFAPIFSSRMIPVRVKLIAAGAISFALMPTALQGQKLPVDSLAVAPLVVKEALVGVAFAVAIGTLSAAVQAAGSLLDTMVGFSFAALVDPINNFQAAIFGQLFALFATVVFLATGGDQVMIMGLGKSYDVIPLGQLPSATHLAALATTGLAQIFVIGLEIAAPVVIAVVLTDVAFGLVSRAVPQMNIFQVGLPAKVLVGFASVAAALPFVAQNLEGRMTDFVFQALTALKV